MRTARPRATQAMAPNRPSPPQPAAQTKKQSKENAKPCMPQDSPEDNRYSMAANEPCCSNDFSQRRRNSCRCRRPARHTSPPAANRSSRPGAPQTQGTQWRSCAPSSCPRTLFCRGTARRRDPPWPTCDKRPCGNTLCRPASSLAAPPENHGADDTKRNLACIRKRPTTIALQVQNAPPAHYDNRARRVRPTCPWKDNPPQRHLAHNTRPIDLPGTD